MSLESIICFAGNPRDTSGLIYVIVILIVMVLMFLVGNALGFRGKFTSSVWLNDILKFILGAAIILIGFPAIILGIAFLVGPSIEIACASIETNN